MAREGDPSDALRGAIRDARLTRILLLLLVTVYTLELLVAVRFGRAGVAYAFLATADPSPGWVLAPFAHSPGVLLHLLTSLVVVGVYGALVESRLGAVAYLALYVGAGYASTAVQVATYAVAPGPGTLGASGAAMALVGFLATDTAMRTASGAPTTLGERVFATTGVAIAIVRVARDLGVVVPAAEGTAPIGHATGLFVGVAYAVWRASGTWPARFLDPGRDR